MKKIAFIGTGNMGGALAKAACLSAQPQEVLVADWSREKAEALAKELGCGVAAGNEEAVRSAAYVVLGVKPQMLGGVLESIAPVVREEAAKRELVVVSMAAGKSLSSLEKGLAAEKLPIIRILPNMPASVGKGMMLVARNAYVTDKALQGFFSLMKESGLLEEIPEHLIDAGGTLNGCAPAWTYLFIEALADGGVQAGVPRASALKYAAQAVAGAAELVLQTGQHPGALKDAVCSPGGTTIAGVKALEDRGFRGAAMSAVMDAYERTLRMENT